MAAARPGRRRRVACVVALTVATACGAAAPRRTPELRALLDAWPPPCPRFDAADDAWSARELLACADDRRRRLPRVPFFVYDGAWLGGRSAAAELAHVEANCSDAFEPGTTYAPYRGDLFFVRQLLAHPWRVRDPRDAALFVPPVFLSLAASKRCAAYHVRDAAAVLRLVTASPLFRARREAHLFVAPWWRHVLRGALRPPVGTVWGWYTAQRLVQPAAELNTSEYTLVAVPQTLAPRAAPAPARRALRAARPLPLLFAGRAADREGGGVGAVRLPLLRAMAALMAPGRGDAGDGAAGRAAARSLPRGGALLVHHPTDATRKALASTRARLPLSRCPESARAQLALAARLGALAPPRPLVCEGDADLGELGVRAQFLLYLRGDKPTTRRMQESAATGAIPLIVSDGVFESGMHFQPLLPYEHLAVELREAEVLAEPAAALGRAVAGVSARRAARTRELLMHFRPDLLWEGDGPEQRQRHDTQHAERAADAQASRPATGRRGAQRDGAVAHRPSRVAENVLLRAAIALAKESAAAAAAAGGSPPSAAAARCCSWFQPDRQLPPGRRRGLAAPAGKANYNII